VKQVERILFRGLALATLSGAALGEPVACSVEPFQGAATPQGAVARMRVTSSAASCSIINYGIPTARANPADTGSITKPPRHGSAEFAAPRASYTPQPGYIGEDEFEYSAYARGRLDQQVRLKVRVKVSLVAP
jgi:hypothetical protein